VFCLYANNEQAEKEVRKTIPFTVTSKKYLCISLTKEMKDLCNGNYKTLKKEIEEDTRRWKDLLCSWIGGINIGQTTPRSNLHIQCNVH
jgi:hypothetical protein